METENLKRSRVKQWLMIILGTFFVACGIHFFLRPSNLTLGGGTAIAIILSKFIPIPLSLILLAVNLLLFLVGFLFIGNAFGKSTVIICVMLSAMLSFLEWLVPMKEPLLQEKFMQLFVAVLLYGSGVGMVLNNYASTGGSDIIAKILQKYLGIPLGRGCQITDFVITLFSGVVFGKEVLIYSLVGVIINGIVIDATINGLNSSKLCFINTDEPELICDFIVKNINRSANIYIATGAYTNTEHKVIQVVLTNREFIRLKQFMLIHTPNAFLVIANASETIGFRWRKYE